MAGRNVPRCSQPAGEPAVSVPMPGRTRVLSRFQHAPTSALAVTQRPSLRTRPPAGRAPDLPAHAPAAGGGAADGPGGGQRGAGAGLPPARWAARCTHMTHSGLTEGEMGSTAEPRGAGREYPPAKWAAIRGPTPSYARGCHAALCCCIAASRAGNQLGPLDGYTT